MDELEKQIEKVIKLIKKRLEDDPKRKILNELCIRYETAKEILEKGGDVRKIMIKGGCRAYLDAFSDYMNNQLLDEMYKAEKLMSDLNKK